LLRKNRRLQQEIDRLHNEVDVSVQPSPIKSREKNNSLLHMKVKELELEVRQLKKVSRSIENRSCAAFLHLIRLVLSTVRR
jgi:hypothetical protein